MKVILVSSWDKFVGSHRRSISVDLLQILVIMTYIPWSSKPVRVNCSTYFWSFCSVGFITFFVRVPLEIPQMTKEQWIVIVNINICPHVELENPFVCRCSCTSKKNTHMSSIKTVLKRYFFVIYLLEKFL